MDSDGPSSIYCRPGASRREDEIFFPGMCFASVSSLVPGGVPGEAEASRTRVYTN